MRTFQMVIMVMCVAFSGVFAAEKETESQAALEKTAPRLADVLTGKYAYGEGYGSRSPVLFTLNLKTNGKAFSGVIEEPYSGFGTAVKGKLYADVVGNIEKVDGKIVVRFTKEYRHFVQPIVKYVGVMDPESGRVAGTWTFPGQDSSGSFSLRPAK